MNIMLRMYLLSFALNVIAGCGGKTSTEPRIVQMPNPTVRQNVQSPNWAEMYKEGAPAETKEFKVFNQSGQSLRLQFFPSALRVYKNFSLEIKAGNPLIARTVRQGDIEILSIHKLGPSAPDAFLKRLIGEGVFENSRCFLDQAEPNIWYLNVQVKEGDHKAIYHQLTHKTEQCGPHAHDWHSPPTTFFVKDGIVIMVRREAEVFGLDISSIVYQNKG